MSSHDVDGLNAGYARALLDEYLENPEAVPSEWRALFESGGSEVVATHPGIARLLETLPQNGENGDPLPVAVDLGVAHLKLRVAHAPLGEDPAQGDQVADVFQAVLDFEVDGPETGRCSCSCHGHSITAAAESRISPA
jgi:2-oxoglutarate dehydrogenase complex dehydrogenase (E1) component-like enzyme